MGKILLSNIAEELATRGALTREAADTFVHAFVATIEQGLRADGVVKVKGLGTFKLQEVSDRDSVDVNTGERITIKGYRKVTFTPDSAMKELVNRPFAHFEPAELNDGYPSDDESLPADSLVDESDEPDVVEEIAGSASSQQQAEPPVAGEEKDVAEETSAKPKRRPAYGWIAVLLIAIVGVGMFYWHTAGLSMEEEAGSSVGESQEMTVKPNLGEELAAEWGGVSSTSSPSSPSTSSLSSAEQHPAVSSSLQETSVSSEKSDSVVPVVAERPHPTSAPTPDVVVITEALQARSLKDITLADTTDYATVATLAAHELKSGETIIYLAKKYYGDKRLWPYIVKHNRMADFNNVAIGQVISIPMLSAKE